MTCNTCRDRDGCRIRNIAGFPHSTCHRPGTLPPNLQTPTDLGDWLFKTAVGLTRAYAAALKAERREP
jgi:hypothetical protein